MDKNCVNSKCHNLKIKIEFISKFDHVSLSKNPNKKYYPFLIGKPIYD